MNKTNELYRHLFETSTDALMTLDPPSWNFTSGNAAAFEMFGVKTEEEFISLLPWQLSPEFQPDGQPSIEKARRAIEFTMENGANSFEWVHQTVDGKPFSAAVRLSRVVLKNRSFIQATVRDVTSQKRLEENLKEYADRYHALFEDAVNGKAVADPNTGIILSCNNALCRLVERTMDDLVGQSQEILHPKNWSSFQAHLNKPGEVIESKIITSSGKILDVEIKASYLNLGSIKLFHAEFRDITERKEAQTRLTESLVKYKTLAKNIPGMVYSGRPDWSVESIYNAEEISGYSSQDFLSNKVNWLNDVCHPEDRDIVGVGTTFEISLPKSTTKVQIDNKRSIEQSIPAKILPPMAL